MHYSFKNTETEEEFTLEMTLSERQPFLDKNPNLIQILSPPVIGDSVRLGIKKPPSDFLKYVVGRVKDTAPGANKAALEKRNHIPREW